MQCSTCDMSSHMFIECTYIKHNDIGVSYHLCKLVH